MLTVKMILHKTIAPVLVVCFVFILTNATGCEQRPSNKPRNETAQPMKTIDDVIKQYADSLMAIPGVVGVYHGLNENGTDCLKVMVKKKSSELEGRIPKKLEGFDVVIDETGEIKPMK
jgi:hypothetical protein